MDIERRDFNAIIKAIQEDDSRYSSGAYYFLREALDYTIKDSEDNDASSRLSQHITSTKTQASMGTESVIGFRSFNEM